jgi:hypothetical protein
LHQVLAISEGASRMPLRSWFRNRRIFARKVLEFTGQFGYGASRCHRRGLCRKIAFLSIMSFFVSFLTWFLPGKKRRSEEIGYVFRWNPLIPVMLSFNVLALSRLGFLFPKGYLEDPKDPQRHSGVIPPTGLVSKSEQRVPGCHNGGPPGP